MCGICGLAPRDGAPVEEALLRRMAGALAHRGPDAEGVLRRPGIGLAVRRLAVVDPAGGSQPIESEDGALALVGNGEIYNAPELRRDLVARGHRFRGGSDLEVAVHLYEELGSSFVHPLRGMFALAVWDGRNRRLVLARDRLGIKPLAWAETPAGVAFASEVKALLAGGLVPARLDPAAVADLLDWGFVRGPRTMVPGVRRLAPGHLLVVEGGRVRTERWWSPSFPGRGDFARRSDDEWAEALAAKLDESVRLHLRADVPVGVWLSGGIDSGAVAALAARAAGTELPAFSLTFADASVDEVGRGGTLADRPGSGLRPVRAHCGGDALELLPTALWHAEEPSASLVELPRLILARRSAAEVTVVLTGEGADEILGGYRWYHGERALGLAGRLPAALRHAAAAVLRRTGRGRTARLLEAPAELGAARFRAMVAPAGAEAARALLHPDLAASLPVGDEPVALPPGAERWPPFCRLQAVDQLVRMPDFIVHTLDRATMAASLEARVPFLDHELLELAASIPPAVKMRGLREKAVLRRALRGLLPPDLLARPKRGMESPVDGWMRGPLPGFAADLLDAAALRSRGVFDPVAVSRLLASHRAGRGGHGRQLSVVLAVGLWEELFVRGRDARSVA